GDRGWGGALDTARRGEAIVRESTAPPGLTFLHGGHAILDVAEMRVLRGDVRIALGLAEMVAGAAERAGWREFQGRAALVLGRARTVAGDPTSDDPLQRAAETGDAVGWPRLSWEARAGLAATGDADAAAPARALVGRSVAGLRAEAALGSNFLRAAEAELDRV